MRQLSILALLALAGCTTVANDREEPVRLSYGCGDLVVVGRLIQTREEAVSSDHILGLSRRQFRIGIKQVVRGAKNRGTLIAEVISHARPREDVDLLIVLRPRPDGNYSIIEFAVWDVRRPALAEPCS